MFQDFRIFILTCTEGLGANIAKGSDLMSATLEEDWTSGWREINILFIKCLCVLAESTCTSHSDMGVGEEAVAPGKNSLLAR